MQIQEVIAGGRKSVAAARSNYSSELLLLKLFVATCNSTTDTVVNVNRYLGTRHP